jgi:hypothetical protein
LPKSKAKPKPKATDQQRIQALNQEQDQALRERIRALLALPMIERTKFLRVRQGKGTAL